MTDQCAAVCLLLDSSQLVAQHCCSPDLYTAIINAVADKILKKLFNFMKFYCPQYTRPQLNHT